MKLNKLLSLLADKKFHSGEVLGAALGVTRTSVWKQLHKLEELGVKIDSVRGKGYRLPATVELLAKEKISAELSDSAKLLLNNIEIYFSVDSTNTCAMRHAQKGANGVICLAEQQTAGRGRRGRQWVSPFANNVYLSLCWQFQGGAAQLEGLSLAVAVAVTQALDVCGVENIKVKWPNDLLWNGCKLAGILLEMTGDATGACQVVVGIGINVDMSNIVIDGIDQPWIDISQITKKTMSRNKIAGKVIDKLLLALDQFQKEGFTPFRKDWLAKDAYAEQHIILTTASQNVVGIEKGVNEHGALCVETAQGMQYFHGGEVSVRAI